MSKKSIIIVLFSLMLLPLSVQASDGIPLQKDVWLDSIPDLQSEIRNHMDLYDSKSATTPIVTQTFATTSPIIPEEEIKWILL
jgi:hypothetical protein